MTNLPELKDGYTWNLWVSETDPETGKVDALISIVSVSGNSSYPNVFQDMSRKYSDTRTAILVAAQELLRKHPRLFKDYNHSSGDVISAFTELIQKKDSK